MRRGCCQWALTLMSLVAFVSCQAATSYAGEEPQFVQLDLTSTDLPAARFDNYFFQILNHSAFADRIQKVSASCGCSRISFPESYIPAGKLAELSLELKSGSVASFRTERALVIWESGRVTPVIIARKGEFGTVVSEQTLIWKDGEVLTPKYVSIYFDDRIYPTIHNNQINSIIGQSTTGAVRVVLEQFDAVHQRVVLSVIPMKNDRTTDIVRVSLPPSVDERQAFILCKIHNNPQ